jgi:hypothetical protein
MAPFKSLTAAAILALALCSQISKAQEQQHVIMDMAEQSPLGGLGNWLEDALEDVRETVDDVRKTVSGVLGDAYDHAEKEWVKVFSHPAFPEYSMRYKKPALCDPDVKQVYVSCAIRNAFLCIAHMAKHAVLFYFSYHGPFGNN